MYATVFLFCLCVSTALSLSPVRPISPVEPITPIKPISLIKSISPVRPPPFTGSEVFFSYNGAEQTRERFIKFTNRLAKENALVFEGYGVFLCTVPGVYEFSFTIHSPEYADARVALKVGFPGRTLAEVFVKRGGHSASHTVLTRLYHNDIVYLTSEGGLGLQKPLYDGLNTFTGKLINKDIPFHSKPFGSAAVPRPGVAAKPPVPETPPQLPDILKGLTPN